MEKPPQFVSYKKMIIFGDQGTGKTSLIKRIQMGSFLNDISHTEDCNMKFYLIFNL